MANQLTTSPGLLQPGQTGTFDATEIEGLPDPVQRYLLSSIAPGVPLSVSAKLQMAGRIKVRRWLSFWARQTLNPHRGFIWSALVAGGITGSDRYVDGEGRMDWKLMRFIKLAQADGPDISRSAAERAAAEAVWLPTALLPRYGVDWEAETDHHITASYTIDNRPFSIRLTIDDDGVIQSLVFNRWGDPDDTGTWAQLPFGGEVTGYGTFHGLTIPKSGRMGWFYGTNRWPEEEFFRFNLTALRPFELQPNPS